MSMMKQMMMVALFGASLGLCSCKSVYYGAMETVGVHKRDIMVDRVEGARDSQMAAQKQFRSALEQFSAVVDVKGGDLEKKYAKLNKEFERSYSRARDVNERIASIESVSKALFKEWKAELKQYSNAELRRASEKQLESTRDQYGVMMESMKNAAAKMDPVLKAFQDQVLFLKHNLNARAIASIQPAADKVKSDVERLILDMEESIAEANAFIKSIGT